MRDFDFRKPLERVSDVIAHLYEVEHAGPYCSPSWGRTGTHAVLCAIVAIYRRHDVQDLVAWLRSTVKYPISDTSVPDLDQHNWDRARVKIADHIEQLMLKEKTAK